MEQTVNFMAKTASPYGLNSDGPWQNIIQKKGINKKDEKIAQQGQQSQQKNIDKSLPKNNSNGLKGQNKNIKNSIYKDPLRTWPLKGLAYTNEIGAAISGVAPKLGTALWAPALMYIGADIYDKWKNEDTSYKPSGRRGVKEAVFQGCASVVLPTAAVGLGQKAASFIARGTKTGLSSQAREDVLKHSLEYMDNHSLSSFENNISGYADGMVESVKNASEAMKDSYRAMHPIKKVLSFINPFKDFDNIGFAKSDKLADFTRAQAEKTMKMRNDLMQNIRPKGMSKKLFNEFQKRKVEYKDIYAPDVYIKRAAKNILEKQHKSQIFKNKLIKTTGGFIALALLIKPIDKFVENVIIKKTVEPSMDFIHDKWQSYPYKGRHRKNQEN